MTKLDKWDLKILSMLEFNYKRSHASIAKAISRSKSFVSYRIKRLEDEQYISYQALIDYSKLGQHYYRVIVETVLEKNQLLAKLSSLEKTVWLVEKYDRENFVFVILAKSAVDFQKTWEEMYFLLSPYILSKDISLAYSVTHFPLSFLHGEKRTTSYCTGGHESIDCTKNELALLKLLHIYPTATQNFFAKNLLLSVATIKSLFSSLEEKKVILAYQTLINKRLLDIQHYKLFLSFEFTKENKIRLRELLSNEPHVVYISETSYHYDLECELFTPDNHTFELVIAKLKKNFSFKRIIISQMKSEQKLA